MIGPANFNYVGGELCLFAHATNWKNYWSRKIAPFLTGDVLEVGAGLGTNTLLLRPRASGQWTCLEPDRQLIATLQGALAAQHLAASCRVLTGTVDDLPPGELFDTLLYIDVLEHIPDDRAELARAAERLHTGGRVIVLSPAHQWLYSEFDKSIGHCRRYSRRTLLAVTPATLRPVKCFYLDSVGLCASLANRLLLRQSLPTLKQILFWDRTIIPVSRVLDPLLCGAVGKTVIGVWERAA